MINITENDLTAKYYKIPINISIFSAILDLDLNKDYFEETLTGKLWNILGEERADYDAFTGPYIYLIIEVEKFESLKNECENIINDYILEAKKASNFFKECK